MYYNTEADKRLPWRHTQTECVWEREDDSKSMSARVKPSEMLNVKDTLRSRWGQRVDQKERMPNKFISLWLLYMYRKVAPNK